MELSMKMVFKEFKHCYAVIHPEGILFGHILLIPKSCSNSFSNLQFEQVMDISLAIKGCISMFEKDPMIQAKGNTVYFKNYPSFEKEGDRRDNM